MYIIHSRRFDCSCFIYFVYNRGLNTEKMLCINLIYDSVRATHHVYYSLQLKITTRVSGTLSPMNTDSIHSFITHTDRLLSSSDPE